MREHSEEALRERIEATRSRMGETVEEIGVRVNPDRVQRELKARARGEIDQFKASVKQKARSTMREFEHEAEARGRGVWRTIKENPVPATMVGVGLGWLMANGRGGEVRDRGAETLERAQDEAERAVSTAREKTSELADRGRQQMRHAREQAGEWADRVEHRSMRAERRVEEAVQENPLAAGAMAAALGFAAGLMVPETQREHEMFGQTRDRVMEKARRSASGAADRARESARETAAEAARQAVDETFPSESGEAEGAMTEPGRE